MTFVVTDNCIKCKYMDCVEVCPVDCFYEGENMLVIHPDECIDCGVCEPECPAEAIFPDTKPGLENWLKLNADMLRRGRISRSSASRLRMRRNSMACPESSTGIFRRAPGKETEEGHNVNRARSV